MTTEIITKDEPCHDRNWTRDVEPWDQVNCPEMAAHKEMEERTGNGYHTVPAPGEPINYDYEN